MEMPQSACAKSSISYGDAFETTDIKKKSDLLKFLLPLIGAAMN